MCCRMEVENVLYKQITPNKYTEPLSICHLQIKREMKNEICQIDGNVIIM